ncbi:MAG TPA: hypothetical protein V6D47_03580 [Oscillatoriaceae cyanobacterium]
MPIGQLLSDATAKVLGNGAGKIAATDATHDATEAATGTIAKDAATSLDAGAQKALKLVRSICDNGSLNGEVPEDYTRISNVKISNTSQDGIYGFSGLFKSVDPNNDNLLAQQTTGQVNINGKKDWEKLFNVSPGALKDWLDAGQKLGF